MTKLMKNILKVLSVALLVGAVSCENNRNDNLTEPFAYFVNSGLQDARYYDLNREPSFSAHIYRSGYFDAPVELTVSVAESAVEEYNVANGTSYRMLPEEYYTLDRTAVSLPKSERCADIVVSFDYDGILALGSDHDYVLALDLSASVAVNERKSSVLVRPVMIKSEMFFCQNHVEELKLEEQSPKVWTREFTVSLPFENPSDCTFGFDTTQSVLDEYNAAHGTKFRIAPSEAFSLEGDFRLPAGVSETTVTLKVDPAKIPDNRHFAIPVLLESNSCDYTINPDNRLYIMYIKQDIASVALDRSGWTLDYANSWHDKISNLYMMLDGSTTTHWEAAYNPSKTDCDEVLGSKAAFHCPFEFVWDFGGEHPLVGVALMRRYNNTDLIAGYFEVSADKETWIKVATFDYITDLADDRKNQGPFRYDFEEESARYMRVVITDSSNKNSTRDTAAIAEIYAYEVEN